MYSRAQIEKIFETIIRAELSCPSEMCSASFHQLQKICNGVGAAWLSKPTRKALTKAFKCAEASTAIHDWRYNHSDGIPSHQRAADIEWRENALEEINYKYHWLNPWKFWQQRKVLIGYDILRRTGEAQWCIDFRNNQLKGKDCK